VFDISFTELMLIGVVALVVIGPERLPKVARTVGHLLGRAQRYVNDVKGDIQREVELEELRKMKQEMEAAASSMKDSFSETESSLREGLHDPLADLKADFERGLPSPADAELSKLTQLTDPLVQKPVASAPDSTKPEQPPRQSDVEPKT
jgi:sec-independent protein translocase protein TatB